MATDTLKIIIDSEHREGGAKAAESGLKGLQDAAKAAALAFGMIKGAQAAWQFLEMGASANRAETALDNLAAAAGTSGKAIVGAIQEASNYTISRMTAMTAANKAMLLGVAESPEQFARLTEVATALGRAMGRDAATSIDDFVVAAGRQSRMIADNLGLMVSAETAQKNYAAQLGKTAEELTETEKKQAFLNEMLRQGEEKLGALSNTTGGAATEIERMNAALSDIKTSAGQTFASFAASTGVLDWVAEKFRVLAEVVPMMGAGFRANMDVFRGIFSGEIFQVGAIEVWKDSFASTLGLVDPATVDVEELTVAEGELEAALEETTAAQAIAQQSTIGLRQSQEQATQAAQDARVAQMELAQTLADASQAQIANAAITQLKAALDAGKISFEFYEAAVMQTQLAYGLATPASITLSQGIAGLTARAAEGKLSADEFQRGLNALMIEFGNAKRGADELAARIRAIPDRTVRVNVAYSSSGEPPQGGPSLTQQHGGWSSGGLTLVGERGPELTYLPRGAFVKSAPETRAALGGGETNVTININGYNADPMELANEIERVQRLAGQRRLTAI
jgi:hypothetical protein